MSDKEIRQSMGLRMTAFELDDFNTLDETTTWELFRLKGRYPELKATLFTLIGLSDHSTLAELARQDWIEIAAHGWDHYSEWRWSYWETRHFLEVVESMSWLQPIFKMPWNRLPSIGFVRALKESGWCLAIPREKRYQAWILKIMRGRSYVSPPSVIWCHPQDLVNLDLSHIHFKFVSDYLGEN